MKSICLLLVFVAAALSAKSYTGYQVLRVTPHTRGQFLRLSTLCNELEDKVDFWKEPRGVDYPVDIMVSPDILDAVKEGLATLGLDTAVFINDVQQGIDDERCVDCVKPHAGFDYTVYHTREQISQWVTDFANEHDMVSEVLIGYSYEVNPIKAIKISSGGAKRAVYIQGGIHAREWISPATVMYMANLMVTQYLNDIAVTEMVDNYDWYIVPLLNVDGYEYSWTNDRMWRKNRQPNAGSSCIGTDLNRNYPYEWGGAGKLPCSETYQGPFPLSGTAVAAVNTWIQPLSGNMALFIDFHNYGQLWLYPWGYTGDKRVPQPDEPEQSTLATSACAALRRPYGTSYFVGESGPDMYPATGASEDYGYGYLGIKYSYIVELRDEGRFGFNIPESMIEESGIETFEALKVMGTDPLA